MDPVIAPPLPPELLAELSASGVTHQFAVGDVLFQEGDASDALYVLIAGQLKVYSAKSNGREVVYSTLEPGQIFGEMFLDGGPRSASVKAISPSSCLIVAGDEIRTLMRAHPSFAEYVAMQVMARLRAATHKMRALALDDVYERVTSLLHASAVEDATGHRIPRHLTQLEIGRQVGATREMVNHVLRDLARGGFIIKDRRHGMTLLKPPPKRW